MKCPGQDTHYWDSNAIFDIDCPKCHTPVEFYKDDTTRKCGNCGHRFVNPKMDFGCAAYCQFAEQCIGSLPEEFSKARDNLLKDKVAVEIKRLYGNDFGKIGAISRVARYAEAIGKKEKVNMGVLLCTVYLHDIGRRELPASEDDGPELNARSAAIASTILEKLGAKEQVIGEVCRQIELFGTDDAGTCPECLVLSDAIQLAAIEVQRKKEQSGSGHTLQQLQSRLLTEGGKQAVRELLP